VGSSSVASSSYRRVEENEEENKNGEEDEGEEEWLQRPGDLFTTPEAVEVLRGRGASQPSRMIDCLYK
jgi:hypothetical protein